MLLSREGYANGNEKCTSSDHFPWKLRESCDISLERKGWKIMYQPHRRKDTFVFYRDGKQELGSFKL